MTLPLTMINISYDSTWSQRAPGGVRSQLDPLGANGAEPQGLAEASLMHH